MALGPHATGLAGGAADWPEEPGLLSMIGLVALIVVTVILVFFGLRYLFGLAFL